jgi:hypothetical protein
MSLIRTRQRRKKSHMDTRKGMPVRQLAFLLIITVGLIWLAQNGTIAEILEPFF